MGRHTLGRTSGDRCHRAWAVATPQVREVGGNRTFPAPLLGLRPDCGSLRSPWQAPQQVLLLIRGKEGTPSVYEPPSQQDSAGQGETGDVEIHHQWCQKGDLLRPRGLLGVRPLVPPVARWGRPVCQAGRRAGRYMWNHGPRNPRASSPRRTKASCKAPRVTEGHKPPRKQTQGWPTFGVKEEEFSDDRLNASWLQNRLDFVQNALVIFNQYGSKLGSNAVTQRQICWANAIPRASVRQ